MSEVERVEGAEGNERAEGVAGIEGVGSYCTTERLWVYPPTSQEVHWTNLVESYSESGRFRIYPLNTLQSAFDQLNRSALLGEEKHLRLCQKPKVRARWSKKCQHIEVR